MKTKHRILGYLVLSTITALIFAFSVLFPDFIIPSSPEEIRVIVSSFGVISFLVYMLLVTLSVPLPIPSTPLIVAGGIIFGTINGFMLALVSVILGSSLSFLLGRIYGKPLVKRLVDEHHLSHLYLVFKKRGKLAIIISYIIPIFPSDVVSLFLGLAPLSYKEFIALLIFTHIPRIFIIIYPGNSIVAGFTPEIIIITLIALLLILISLFREHIKKVVFTELRAIERRISVP